MNSITISFLVMDLLVSIPLWRIIYQYISKKPLLAHTLVDRIYQDTIIYINCVTLFFSAASIQILLFGGKTLNLSFEFALFYGLILSFFVNCICASVTFSGGIRLISLVKNSEASNLLGSENVAIFKVRLATILFTVLLLSTSIGYLGAMPTMFGLFYGGESQSDFKDITLNKFKLIYIFQPLLAFAVNVAAKLYSSRIERQMKEAQTVFAIFGNQSLNKNTGENKFSFSLGYVALIPLIFLMTYLYSFSSQRMKILFLGPFELSLFSLCLPATFIYYNKKIKKEIMKNPIFCKIDFAINYIRKTLTVRIVPSN